MDGSTVEHRRSRPRTRPLRRCRGPARLPRGGTWSDERQDRILRDFAAYCESRSSTWSRCAAIPARSGRCPDPARAPASPRGRRCVLAWAYHPKPLPTAVPVSAAIAAASQGMALTIAHPPGYELDEDDMATIRRVAHEAGRHPCWVSPDLEHSLIGADVVYVKSWARSATSAAPPKKPSSVAHTATGG